MLIVKGFLMVVLLITAIFPDVSGADPAWVKRRTGARGLAVWAAKARSAPRPATSSQNHHRTCHLLDRALHDYGQVARRRRR